MSEIKKIVLNHSDEELGDRDINIDIHSIIDNETRLPISHVAASEKLRERYENNGRFNMLFRKQSPMDVWTKKFGWRIVDKPTKQKLVELSETSTETLDMGINRLFIIDENELPNLYLYEKF
jgi:hypothetical protein